VASPSDLADALIAEGNRAEESGRLHEACERYREAVAAASGYAKAHLNLGIGLEASGDAGGAIGSFEAALAIEPRNPFANYNLGNLLFKRGDLGRAEALLRLALEARPGFPEAHVALSNVYDSRGDLPAAAAALESALKARPDYVGALYSYGATLRKLQRPAEAETALRRALRIDPGFLPAHELLGAALRGQSRIKEALDSFAAARKLAPEKLGLESAELFTLNYLDEISSEALFARHKAFGERLERTIPRRFHPPRGARDPERRLRIGYVSGDFWRHPVALFALPLLERHDRRACEVYCYSSGAVTDEVTQAVRAAADVFRDVASMPDDELADAIRGDGIDILVDLSGHSGVHRLGVFAQQPSPVQATWLGYPQTTGLTRIGYRICDAGTDPPGMTERLHTETLFRLPYSQWCYRPPVAVDCGEEPPCRKNGFITFGSFNHVSKLSPSALALWAEILAQVPDSRLLIASVPQGSVEDALLRDLGRAGVAASRVTLVPRVALDEHFRWFNAVDIALDTMPFGGVTTTFDTLWMGVPVITLPGTRPPSRNAASILTTVGLSRCIASTPADYVRLAAEWAVDAAAIGELRRTLRERMRASPLMDEPRFARDMEAAYRRMWRAWCESGAD
jgi:predicted O-linked N-acetylglucosamine transferase (SPINDLY family)